MTPSAYKRLPHRKRRFLDEWLLGRKGADAMRAIGFTGRRPEIAASKMLADPLVRAALMERREQLSDATGVRQEMVVHELAKIAFGDIRDLYDENGKLKPVHELSEMAAAQLAGVEVEELFEGKGSDRLHIGRVRKIKRWDKVKALSELAMILGLRKPSGEQSAGTIVNGNVVQVAVNVHIGT